MLRPLMDQEAAGPVPPRLCPLWPHLPRPQGAGDLRAVMEAGGAGARAPDTPEVRSLGSPAPGGPLTGGLRVQLQQQDQPEQSRCQRGGRPPARAPHPGTGHRTDWPAWRGPAEAAEKPPPAGGEPLT